MTPNFVVVSCLLCILDFFGVPIVIICNSFSLSMLNGCNSIVDFERLSLEDARELVKDQKVEAIFRNEEIEKLFASLLQVSITHCREEDDDCSTILNKTSLLVGHMIGPLAFYKMADQIEWWLISRVNLENLKNDPVMESIDLNWAD